MLVPCAALVTDRAQGLRRMAEFVANVVPELGNGAKPSFGSNRSVTQ